MRTPITIALLVSAVILPGLATAEPAAAQPVAVVAVPLATDTALVTWTPGAEAADAYRIYGKLGDGLVLVTEVSGTTARFAALVDGGYDGYAVSAIVGSGETGATEAAWGGPYCLYVDPWTVPPGVGIRPCWGSEAVCTDSSSEDPCRVIGVLHVDGFP